MPATTEEYGGGKVEQKNSSIKNVQLENRSTITSNVEKARWEIAKRQNKWKQKKNKIGMKRRIVRMRSEASSKSSKLPEFLAYFQSSSFSNRTIIPSKMLLNSSREKRWRPHNVPVLLTDFGSLSEVYTIAVKISVTRNKTKKEHVRAFHKYSREDWKAFKSCVLVPGTCRAQHSKEYSPSAHTRTHSSITNK